MKSRHNDVHEIATCRRRSSVLALRDQSAARTWQSSGRGNSRLFLRGEPRSDEGQPLETMEWVSRRLACKVLRRLQGAAVKKSLPLPLQPQTITNTGYKRNKQRIDQEYLRYAKLHARA